MLLNMGDRYILLYLIDADATGLYDLAYSVAGILTAFLLQPVSLAFLPQSYKLYRQPGDRRYYSKMQTYVVLATIWMALGLAFFGDIVVRTLARSEAYWSATAIIPLLLLGNVFFAGRLITMIGLLVKKRTQVAALTVVVATVVNILLNFWLIPKWGLYGAALATVLAYFLLYILTYYFAQNSYKIPYENMKLVKVLLLALLLYFLPQMPGNSPTVQTC